MTEDRFNPEGALDPDDAEVQAWWARLPDFIKPDYPFDIPPARLPFVQFVLTAAGAPKFCPVAACRRARACQGNDGPPCFRADRRDLHHVLLLSYMIVFHGCSEETYEAALRARGSRYASAPEPTEQARKGRRARRKMTSHRGRPNAV